MHSPSRRRVLQVITVSASAAALMPSRLVLAAMASDAIAISRTAFPQSVASGDPRPDRVLLWTRITDDPAPSRVRVQVADDPAFTALRVDRDVAVYGDSDGCVKVRITGLQPGTGYHFRFLLDDGEQFVASPIGRTRTAAAADADVPVRFAFMSCQDFGGRWYNTLLPLLEQELDFVLHLGDFIYETVGAPGFQSVSAERSITFDDRAGAIALGDADSDYFAARSLSNYRQLHRSFRSDPVLQALLERVPLVAIWDDHEFSDDCWQDNGTYADGAHSERDGERRRNAEQAYFEYLPVDVDSGGDDGLPVARDRLFPKTKIWRDLRFGRNLHLLLTDYRSARPDHLIPEDAFPGALIFDRAALHQRLPELGLRYTELEPSLIPYLDLDTPAFAPLRAPLRAVLEQAYLAAGQSGEDAARRADAAAKGQIALPALNQFLAAYNANAPTSQQVALPPADADYERGLPWLALGKTRLFDAIGSRYFVVKDSYDLYVALRGLDGIGSAYGSEQAAWLSKTLSASDANWKVVASSMSFTSLVLDLARPELQAPAAMRRQFYLNVDQWDGFPQERKQLLDNVFDKAGGVIVLSGDIHAGFVTQHSAHTVEFTTPAVSSETLKGILARSVGGIPDAPSRRTGEHMVAQLDELLMHGFDALRYANTDHHGVGVLALDGVQVDVRLLELPGDACQQRLYDAPRQLRALSEERRFSVARASMQIKRVS